MGTQRWRDRRTGRRYVWVQGPRDWSMAGYMTKCIGAQGGIPVMQVTCDGRPRLALALAEQHRPKPVGT